jgi:hypothetical protein
LLWKFPEHHGAARVAILRLVPARVVQARLLGYYETLPKAYWSEHVCMQFRVLSPFQAVSLAVHKERFVTLPVGAIVETSADLQGPGLVTVQYGNNTLLALIRDIVKHTERDEGHRLSVGAWGKIARASLIRQAVVGYWTPPGV